MPHHQHGVAGEARGIADDPPRGAPGHVVEGFDAAELAAGRGGGEPRDDGFQVRQEIGVGGGRAHGQPVFFHPEPIEIGDV